MANEFDDRLDDKDVKNALKAWRESAEKQVVRDDWFWARQRARIEARLAEPYLQRMPKLAWAGIAATLALGVALIVPGQKASHTDQPAKAASEVQAQISDHELMQQLQETMNSSVPDALQPASTLAQEMEQAYSSTKVTVKESRQ